MIMSAGNSSVRPRKMDGNPPGILRDPGRKLTTPTDIPHILPHEKVFPIQIGSELFRLSGASISSDAPSYFSSFFRCQLDEAEQKGDGGEAVGIRTLYIDRDPVTFADISRHLQGYHIKPRDGSHFVKLFADAQFYQLPRLVDQLYEDSIYVSIGGREFQIPKDLFSSPGDSPNYFTLGFAFLFTSSSDVFPGLEGDGLLRPPSIMPPAIPNRSADIFHEILLMLRGYPVHIRDEDHRGQLLRDCKYFLFKGLEQKLVPHRINFNLLRQRDEITIRLEDIRQPGLSVVSDANAATPEPRQLAVSGWVNYARPYVDNKPYELVLEIGGECTKLNIHTMRAEFFGDGKTRISRLFEVVANKMNLPTTQPLGLLMISGGASSQPASPGNTPLSDDQVKISFDDTAVTLDEHPWHRDSVRTSIEDDAETASTSPSITSQGMPARKRRKMDPPSDAGGEAEMWIVRTGQWRLRVQRANNAKSGIECVLVAVKLDAVTSQLSRNEQRSFL